jgi:flagellin-like hook-associated protein FlgL
MPSTYATVAALLLALATVVAMLLGSRCRPCDAEMFAPGGSDTVVDWIRDGLGALGDVPDLVRTDLVGVSSVDIGSSVVWRAYVANTDDGLFVYRPDTQHRLQAKLNRDHPAYAFVRHYDAKVRALGLANLFPTFDELTRGLFTLDALTDDVTFSGSVVEIRAREHERLYDALLRVSLLEVCEEHPMLASELVRLEALLREHTAKTKADREKARKAMQKYADAEGGRLDDLLRKKSEAAIDAVRRKAALHASLSGETATLDESVAVHKEKVGLAEDGLHAVRARTDALARTNAQLDAERESLVRERAGLDPVALRQEAKASREALDQSLQAVQEGAAAAGRALRMTELRRNAMAARSNMLDADNRSMEAGTRSILAASKADADKAALLGPANASTSADLDRFQRQYVAASAEVDDILQEIRKQRTGEAVARVELAEERRRLESAEQVDSRVRVDLAASEGAASQVQLAHDEFERQLLGMKQGESLRGQLTREAEANVALLARLEEARRRLKAIENALEDVDRYKTDLGAAQSDLGSTRSDLAQTRQDLETARATVRELAWRSRQDGVEIMDPTFKSTKMDKDKGHMTNAARCQALCMETAGCRGYTWDKEKHNCALKKSANNRTGGKKRFMSGWIE